MLNALLVLVLAAAPLDARASSLAFQQAVASAPDHDHGSIAGSVVDATTGAPLPGVLITVPAIRASTTTDAKGAFRFAVVPSGRQTLFVSLIGYGLARPAIDVAPNAMTTISVSLVSGTGAYTDHATVTADRFRPVDSSVASEQVLTSGEMQDLRGVLADDPFRAIQALPGVATGDDFRSEFSVRGSDFDHMGISIDGVAVPWPVHSVQNYQNFGSVAFINGDIVDHVQLDAGAYPQIHPGRTGAWLDFDIRDGSRQAFQVRAAAGMTSASVVAEGPIGHTHRGSWLVSVRQSYVQWLLSKLDYTGAKFGFDDVQAKAVFDVTPRQQITFTLAGGRSSVEQDDDNGGVLTDGHDHAGVAILGWTSTFGSLTLRQHVAVIGDRFSATFPTNIVIAESNASASDPSSKPPRSSSTSGVYSADLVWRINPAFLASAGGYGQWNREAEHMFSIGALDGTDATALITFDAGGRSRDLSAYSALAWTPTKSIRIDMGARLVASTTTTEVKTTPWLLGTLPIGTHVSLRAGVSSAAQVPDVEQVHLGSIVSALSDEAATSTDVGLEYRPRPSLRVQFTAYDREERHDLRLESSELELFGDQVTFPEFVEKNPPEGWHNAVNAQSRGFEITVQRRATSGLSGWVGYSYGKTRDHDMLTGETYWADFDQRHTLNIYGQERISPKTTISAKLRVGSNFPIPGYFSGTAENLFVGTARNITRLPVYARLDLRANHAFIIAGHRMTLFAEIINVLNRTNYIAAVGEVDFSTGRTSYFTSQLFPFLPSVGFTVEF